MTTIPDLGDFKYQDLAYDDVQKTKGSLTTVPFSSYEDSLLAAQSYSALIFLGLILLCSGGLADFDRSGFVLNSGTGR